MNKKDYDRRTHQVASTSRIQVKTKEEKTNLAMKQFNDSKNMRIKLILQKININ